MRAIFKQAAFALTAMLFAIPLSAQASRTWISGVGDDANPGSRTAPCKTFAGAISKTAAGGEIDCLDPGGFGAITITKAITFDGGGGQVASILVAGTNGIVVQAGANDVVVLRNLRINGIYGSGSGGLNGIRFVSGKALVIENCFIDGFLDAGVDVAVSTAANISISNTLITGAPGNAASIGLTVEGTAAQAKLDLQHVRLWNNGHAGINCGTGTLSAQDCTITGSDYGIVVFGNTNAEFDSSSISDNNIAGLRMIAGTLRLSDCTITGNASGVSITGGTVSSFGNNRIAGNLAANGPLTGTISLQ